MPTLTKRGRQAKRRASDAATDRALVVAGRLRQAEEVSGVGFTLIRRSNIVVFTIAVTNPQLVEEWRNRLSHRVTEGSQYAEVRQDRINTATKVLQLTGADLSVQMHDVTLIVAP